MENRRNRQIRKTREQIQNALLVMLESNDINRISIRELCQKAQINRTTFYNHYGSQYDVLKDMADQYLEDIGKTLSQAHPSDREAVHRQVELVLKYMEEHLELSRLLMNNPSSDFPEMLFSIPGVRDLLEHTLPADTDRNLREATVSFAISGSWKILRDWIACDQRIPAGQEAQMILMLAGKVCH